MSEQLTVREATANYAGAVCLDDSLWPDEKQELLHAALDLLDDVQSDDGWDDDDSADEDDDEEWVEDDGSDFIDVDLSEDRGDESREWLTGLI